VVWPLHNSWWIRTGRMLYCWRAWTNMVWLLWVCWSILPARVWCLSLVHVSRSSLSVRCWRGTTLAVTSTTKVVTSTPPRGCWKRRGIGLRLLTSVRAVLRASVATEEAASPTSASALCVLIWLDVCEFDVTKNHTAYLILQAGRRRIILLFHADDDVVLAVGSWQYTQRQDVYNDGKLVTWTAFSGTDRQLSDGNRDFLSRDLVVAAMKFLHVFNSAIEWL
jgi:hypothetical protein